MRRGSKVVHISTVHNATDVRIFHKEASTLKEAGLDVEVVAPFDKDTVINGIKIHALSQRSKRISRMTLLAREAMKIAVSRNADIYHIHDPELIPYAFFYLKLLHNKIVIVDIHEDLPAQILSKEWIPTVMRKPLSVAAKVGIEAVIRGFDYIIFAEPLAVKRFAAKKNINNIVVIQNFPKISEFSDLLSISIPYKTRPHDFIYLGGISRIRGALEMVQAMSYINDGLSPRLLLGGKFIPTSLQNMLEKEPGWSKVLYLGWLSRRDVIKYLQSVRAGVVTLHPEPNYVEAYPVKMFEYMAAGIPVIASDFPLWREILMRERAGLLVDPKDPKSIADAMTWVLEHPLEAAAMGKRGQKAVLKHYNWERESKKLLALYEELLG